MAVPTRDTLRVMMIENHDFSRVEFDWLAVDGADHLAFISTGGAGPVPEASLQDADGLDGLHDRLMKLPIVCAYKPVSRYEHNIGDWIEIARRGLFAFDWRRESSEYRLIAAPEEPLELGSLSDDEVRQLATHVRLGISFDQAERFDGAVDVLSS